MWAPGNCQVMNIIHLGAQRKREMNLVTTQFFVSAIDRMEGSHELRQGNNLGEFMRTGTKVIAVAIGARREFDKPIMKLRS